jgi:hypothetical protein
MDILLAYQLCFNRYYCCEEDGKENPEKPGLREDHHAGSAAKI